MHCTWPFFCTYKELPLGEKRLQAVSNTLGEARARQPLPETDHGTTFKMARCGGALCIVSFIALCLYVPIAIAGRASRADSSTLDSVSANSIQTIQMVLHICITGEKRNQHKGSKKDNEYDFNDNHFPNLAVYLVMNT